jgi:hypothetical protein
MRSLTIDWLSACVGRPVGIQGPRPEVAGLDLEHVEAAGAALVDPSADRIA